MGQVRKAVYGQEEVPTSIGPVLYQGQDGLVPTVATVGWLVGQVPWFNLHMLSYVSETSNPIFKRSHQNHISICVPIQDMLSICSHDISPSFPPTLTS